MSNNEFTQRYNELQAQINQAILSNDYETQDRLSIELHKLIEEYSNWRKEND